MSKPKGWHSPEFRQRFGKEPQDTFLPYKVYETGIHQDLKYPRYQGERRLKPGYLGGWDK